MAHAKHTQDAARAAYIHDNLPLERISDVVRVPLSTLRNWKRKARMKGDDWDKLRAANLLAGEGLEAVQRQMLADYVNQHKSLMAEVLTNVDMTAGQKVDALASLADSFNKIVAASRRVLPETSELSTALQTMNLLVEFVRREFPQHGPAIVEIIEPFGAELAKKFA